MGTGHGLVLTATGRHRGRLGAVLAITVGVAVAEVCGALVSGSLVLLADAAHLAAVAVIGTGIVVAATGFTRADPIASLAVAVLILPRTWRLLRDAVDVLLESSPRGIDLTEVRTHLTALDGVVGVHDLHAWTIT